MAVTDEHVIFVAVLMRQVLRVDDAADSEVYSTCQYII